MEPRKCNLASNYKSHIHSKFKPILPHKSYIDVKSLPSLMKILKMEGTKITPNYKWKEFRKYNGEKRHQLMVLYVRFIL
jgi:hypothetical protein